MSQERKLQPIISTQSLSKTIDFENKKVVILPPTNLTIQQGEVHAIQGKSGSGKSTLLNILGTLDQPSSGKYLYKNNLINDMNQNTALLDIRRSFGFVFQNYSLIRHLNIYDNILLPAQYAGNINTKTHTHAYELIHKLDLESEVDKKPHQLSGGQQQRASIARALINRPEVVFADEPTGALDNTNSQIVMDIFKKINAEFKTTVVMVTHDQDIANFADHITYIQTSSEQNTSGKTSTLSSSIQTKAENKRC